MLFDEYVAVFSNEYIYIQLDKAFTEDAQSGEINELVRYYDIFDQGDKKGSVVIFKREVEAYAEP